MLSARASVFCLVFLEVEHPPALVAVHHAREKVKVIFPFILGFIPSFLTKSVCWRWFIAKTSNFGAHTSHIFPSLSSNISTTLGPYRDFPLSSVSIILKNPSGRSLYFFISCLFIGSKLIVDACHAVFTWPVRSIFSYPRRAFSCVHIEPVDDLHSWMMGVL